ncbi:MAG: TlpA family protein disulfide reductase [Ignavibacteriales bacterium]|nr:TlpA family protein disulfide reductase [Ignavibacteriales bacterium]
MKSVVRLVTVFFLLTATVHPFQSKEKAPNFSLKLSNGKSLTLSKLKGKVVLLNFWATWCGPCRAEIPGFLEVYEKYKAKGLEIVGISLDETGWQDITPFVKRHNISYPIVVGDQKVVKAYGDIYGIPTSFVIDKKGFIVDKHVGLLTREMLENKIKDLL